MPNPLKVTPARMLARGMVGIAATAFSGCSGGSAATAPTCTLPTVGTGLIRLVNAGTQGPADFCVRVHGSADWGTPILARGGSGGICGSGLAYATATIPFSVAAGTLDVKAISRGAQCAGAATSEEDGVSVGETASGAAVMTVLRLGGGSSPEVLVALPEESAPQPYEEALRLVNGFSGNTAINMGVASSLTLPATVQASGFPTNIPPAAVEPAGMSALGTVDPAGYVDLPPYVPLNVGVTLAGQTSAVFVVRTPTTPDRQTLFAIGDASDPAHPLRGLFCEDVPPPRNADAGGGAVSLLAQCE